LPGIKRKKEWIGMRIILGGQLESEFVMFVLMVKAGEWNCKLYGISGGQQLLITFKEEEGPPTTALISRHAPPPF